MGGGKLPVARLTPGLHGPVLGLGGGEGPRLGVTSVCQILPGTPELCIRGRHCQVFESMLVF